MLDIYIYVGLNYLVLFIHLVFAVGLIYMSIINLLIVLCHLYFYYIKELFLIKSSSIKLHLIQSQNFQLNSIILYLYIINY